PGHRRAAGCQDRRDERARCAAVGGTDATRRAGSLRWRGQRTQRRGAGRPHPERLIERYTRPEIGAVWTDHARMDTWLQVEVAGVEALAQQGLVPEGDARQVRDRAAFTVEAVPE